ncbi:helix-turn-helix domain-containing protein [Ensifer sp. BR816]|uniref:helix-turn-helix domain-containing protein n=1 Tax=Rhizobium sp. (strain BR816) TaxID=1057002 RepID=UPI000362A4BA|nr:helix-turn-helix domain-containing protein [Ensifer sp. BR816]
MDVHADHGGDTLPIDIHSQPFATALEALRRVDQDDPPRPVELPLKRANQARKEATEFNHKAVHILIELGWTTCAIAGELDISQRTVRRLREQPCEALEVELRETRERGTRAARISSGPFFNEDFPEDRETIQLDEALPTREKVRRCLRLGKMSQAEIARRLGVSRQAVSKHWLFNDSERGASTVHAEWPFGRPPKRCFSNFINSLAG